jgi:hypothetical protein
MDFKIRWENIGRDKIEYSGRIELIPTSIWMNKKQIMDELSSRLFERRIFWKILDLHGVDEGEVGEVVIDHVSCWMQYHVFRLGVRVGEEYFNVAINLLPPSQKEGIFLKSWELAKRAFTAGTTPEPLLLSEDGRLFVQEWVNGVVVSEITGEVWLMEKDRTLKLICDSIRRLFQKRLVFYPISDYEIMIKDERALFLDITRFREIDGEDIEVILPFYRNALIKNCRIVDLLYKDYDFNI